MPWENGPNKMFAAREAGCSWQIEHRLEAASCRTPIGWQEGYCGFSVSASRVAMVADTIRSQAGHHKARTFEDEFCALLDRHGIEYDERFFWK